MRISDWSSDVCSSDLTGRKLRNLPLHCRSHSVGEGGIVRQEDRLAGRIMLRLAEQVSSSPFGIIFPIGNHHDFRRTSHHVDSDNAIKLSLGLRHPCIARASRSEEHTSELQSLMRISYAVFCLKKK